MATLQVRETFVNETKGHQIGETEWYEPYTDNMGRLFLNLQKEYGRCLSRMYRELNEDDSNPVDGVPVGWVFSRRERYADARGRWSDRLGRTVYGDDDHYIREVWVEVRTIADPGTDIDDETLSYR